MIMPRNDYKKSASGSFSLNSCRVSIKAIKRMLYGCMHILMKLTAAASATGKMTSKGYKNAEVVHVYEHWSQGGESPVPFIFLDVRSPAENAEVHITGSTLIPVRMLASRLHEVPKNKCIYVYCHSGWRSAKASALLAGADYSNIVNVLGGIEAWQHAGYPVIK
jgi:hydroxyacylglutathione hydrolase